MIARIIRWSARNVFLVGLATIFVTLAGIHTVKQFRSTRPDLSHRVKQACPATGRGSGRSRDTAQLRNGLPEDLNR